MNCRICGGDVDDPFWDELCPECEHDSFHNQGARFEPSCGSCIAEAEQHYEAGLRFDGKSWVDPNDPGHLAVGHQQRRVVVIADKRD